jgi:hypothetical protein
MCVQGACLALRQKRSAMCAQGVSTSETGAQTPRVHWDVPSPEASPSATCAQGVCPAPRQEPKHHVSPYGFSSIVITMF